MRNLKNPLLIDAIVVNTKDVDRAKVFYSSSCMHDNMMLPSQEGNLFHINLNQLGIKGEKLIEHIAIVESSKSKH
jgi:hypothetical protein